MIALEALKGRLVDGLLQIQKEEGYVARERFIFNRGATDEQLALLPAWTADDYQTFLRQHNGAKLSSTKRYPTTMDSNSFRSRIA
ncbi:hypothetical protein [Exiguobacterium sp. s161]|uniref:hypothetical protein n=1 Tax=Exiguobacterium sp. s161 TaxID=2751191 RepID=UPI0020375638|nr:hypothetical protein [Exiguobacterium sp. s161]